MYYNLFACLGSDNAEGYVSKQLPDCHSYVNFQMMWHFAAANCGVFRLQIASILHFKYRGILS